MAELVTQPALRISLLQMAETWLKLYDQSLRNTDLDLPGETPPPQASTPQQQQMQQQVDPEKDGEKD